MYSLERVLIDLDLDLLHVVADLWDVELAPGLTVDEVVERLVEGMTQPQAVTETWSRLSEAERDALAALQAHEGRLPLAQFTRQFGEIRPMGTARREREKPWLEPSNPTEGLYYRGLIARAFDQGPGGVQEYVFVPLELLSLLPTPAARLTPPAPGHALEGMPPERTVPASQSAPDDLTTLLAYFRLRNVDARDELAAPGSLPNLARYLVNADPGCEALLIHLAYELGLLANDEEDITRPVADSAKPWLEAPRLHQLRSLGEAWRDSAGWNDLGHVPGLEADEWPNDPLAARRALLDMLGRVPPGVWWSLESFVATIKAQVPDFQRPGGDYDSWYIRDAESEEVLQGFENWERVDGALVRWLLSGPLHCLGLLDLHTEANAFRLTPSGAALLELAPWPSEPDPEARLSVDDQSFITVPTALSRFDRYLAARFAAWRDVPDPEEDVPAYTYQMTPPSLQRAAEQGIAVTQVLNFLARTSAVPVPDSVEKALTAWEERGAEVVLHDVVVLVAKDFGIYERLREEESVRRWLGQPLGPNAHAIARRDVPALLAALRRLGMLPLFEDFADDEAP
jgi:hypothetical protein